MAKRKWEEAATYAAVIVVAGGTYYLAQSGINLQRATLPAKVYLDCIYKVSTFDWGKYGVEPPLSSEVCKDLTSRETVAG